MPRMRWRHLQKWQRAALASMVAAAALAIMGVVVYLNLLERQALDGGSDTGAGGVDATVKGATGAVGPPGAVIPDHWASFEGTTLSLSLPAWFVGGRPDDADTRTALESVVGMDLDEWFEIYARSTLEQSEVELLIAGAIGVGGQLIVVTAEVENLPPTSSLEAYAEELSAWFGDGDASVEMIGEDRAYCRFGFRPLDEGAGAMAARVALIRSPDGALLVSYTAPAESRGTLDSIFDASAGTIMIKE